MADLKIIISNILEQPVKDAVIQIQRFFTGFALSNMDMQFIDYTSKVTGLVNIGHSLGYSPLDIIMLYCSTGYGDALIKDTQNTKTTVAIYFQTAPCRVRFLTGSYGGRP